ncbi:MAG TPA: hypothetical protein VI934_02060 [Candidatus Nanoarchaeia archaeon]|nr:hypothetical protein [Candidatus Nanoarchaeia archaeon]
MAADLEALVARLSSGLDTSSSPEARLHLLADVLQEAGPDLRLPFFSALPSDVSLRLERDYLTLSKRDSERLPLVQRVNSLIRPLQSKASPGAAGAINEWYTASYVNDRLISIAVIPDSALARNIRTHFFAPSSVGFGDNVLFNKADVDLFFNKAKGYSFLNYSGFFAQLSITSDYMFNSLRMLANEPDKPVVVIGNGRGFEVFLKKASLTHETVAERIKACPASPASGTKVNATADLVPQHARQILRDTQPPELISVVVPECATRVSIAATYGLSALTVDRIMAGLGMSNLEESSRSALADFLNIYYVLEDRAVLRERTGMKSNQLLERLGKLSWNERSLTQTIGMRQLGFVHAYRIGDESRLVNALLAPLTPFLPSDNLYDVLAAENVSRYEVSYLFGLHNSGGGANASLELWAQSGELVPSASGTYNGLQIVRFAISKRRSLFFASLGYTGKKNDDILLSAEKDFDGYVPKPAVGSLAQLPY